MIKFGLLLALLFLGYFYIIYKKYRSDKKRFFTDTGLLLFLLFATGFSKYTLVYLPLFVLHMVLILFAWGYFTLYLLGRFTSFLAVFSPLFSIGLYFVLGEFVASM